MPVIEWLQGVFEGRKKQSEERKLNKKIDDQLIFAKSEPLTMGVECELGLLDKETLLPVGRGPELINLLNSPYIKQELFEHMVEITSAVGKNAHDIENQLEEQIMKLLPAANQRGLLVTGTGCPPTMMRKDLRRVPDERYQRLQTERGVLNERFGTLGMHMHIGMADAEQSVRYHNFFMHFIPHLIALSGSSPFEEGKDTGLMAIRPTIAESLPVAGTPYNFKNWQEYVALCHALHKAGSIQNLKDLWWDVRSCPRYGTIEIRVCDQPPTLAEVVAIAAFAHGLANWFNEHQSWQSEMPRPNPWMMRDNKWRAMRYGVKANLILNSTGETRPIADDFKQWIERIDPYVKRFGYQDHMDTLRKIIALGNSAERQKRVWESTQSLEDVAKFNCDEFAAGTPQWQRSNQDEVQQPAALAFAV